ncbi:MAG: hypothetical protein AVDCRST_MAG86-4264, partial [uncultured Truepera sp.]
GCGRPVVFSRTVRHLGSDSRRFRTGATPSVREAAEYLQTL